MGLQPPHLLLASSNARQMLENLRHILDESACVAIQEEINSNVELLFRLGEAHYEFAVPLSRRHWRQRISRLYYGAYNVRRAVQLHSEGVYNTDTKDHKRTKLPPALSNADIYGFRLQDLREDRNLSDYDHAAVETDLILTQDEAEAIVRDFISDAKEYFSTKGVIL